MYGITKQFPSEEKFGLVSQLRRASVSIPSNIAEGFSRSSAKEKIRFYEIAYGSCIEIYNQLIISKGLHFISEEYFYDLERDLIELQKLLSSLRKGAKDRI